MYFFFSITIHPSCSDPLIWESVTQVVIHNIEYSSSEDSFHCFLCFPELSTMLLGACLGPLEVWHRCGSRLFFLVWNAFDFTFKRNICICCVLIKAQCSVIVLSNCWDDLLIETNAILCHFSYQWASAGLVVWFCLHILSLCCSLFSMVVNVFLTTTLFHRWFNLYLGHNALKQHHSDWGQ